jgi:hypothetical protein
MPSSEKTMWQVESVLHWKLGAVGLMAALEYISLYLNASEIFLKLHGTSMMLSPSTAVFCHDIYESIIMISCSSLLLIYITLTPFICLSMTPR